MKKAGQFEQDSSGSASPNVYLKLGVRAKAGRRFDIHTDLVLRDLEVVTGLLQTLRLPRTRSSGVERKGCPQIVISGSLTGLKLTCPYLLGCHRIEPRVECAELQPLKTRMEHTIGTRIVHPV